MSLRFSKPGSRLEPGALLAAALGASAAFLGGACNDQVGCVFTTNGCDDDGGRIAENEAVLPVDGEWIVDGAPVIDSFFPAGTQNSTTTPVVLVFNETMQTDSLRGAVEIVPQAGTGAGRPVPAQEALVSDGRVLVLLPSVLEASDLEAGEYVVQLADDALLLDLTGQALDREPGEELLRFTVATTPPASPRLVMTFPADNADNQSETSEIVAVFDRPVLPTSVTQDSFDVRVNNLNPLNDPPAAPLTVQGAPETRVFRYRSLGPDGLPAPLGTDAAVQLRLSPASDPITEEDDGVLAPATIDFGTLAFTPPVGASLLSDPNDAIGIANLTAGNDEELTIEVELDVAVTNDFVDLFLFGEQKSTDAEPPLVALLPRSVRLGGSGAVQSAIFTRQDVDLQLTSDGEVHFNDGPVTFGFRLRRGNVVTPIRLLDLDPAPDTIQDPLLDTDVPAIESLVGSTGTSSFDSDQRGLSLAGTGDEELRGVEVTTPLGNNGPLAPVVGTTPTGTGGAKSLFLAAPAGLGRLVAGNTTFTAVARDQAQNGSTAVNGTFTQFGAVGPAPFAPGDSIVVEVFDASTLELLDDALVLVHSDLGNRVDFPFFQAGTTGPDGKATVGTAGAPSVAAIVTVERAGFDLFTLHGVPSTRLSVPLRASADTVARIAGVAITEDAGVEAFLPGLNQRFDDSRRAVELPRGIPGFACTSTPGALTCCLPAPIRVARLGATSFFAGDFSQDLETSFQSSQLLRAFALAVPLAPASSGEVQPASLTIPSLLDDPNTAPEDATQPTTPFTFLVEAGTGVDLLDQVDDPETTGKPHVSVETLVPGLGGATAVALGLAYEVGSSGDRWTIRAAMPGAITAAGSLGSDGLVDSDPFVRVEVLDVPGNAAGVRPRLSAIPTVGPVPVFRALATPVQLAPAADVHTGGEAFTLFLKHAIGDDRTEPGLYRVELLDTAGRGWELWRFDPAGTDDVQVRVVDVGDAAGTGLADGVLISTTAAFAWSSLDPTDFLWSDVEREFELFSRAAPLSFEKP